MGGVWEDVQMVSPSLSLVTTLHQGEATNPSSIANVVDHVRYSHPIVRNDINHVGQVAMPGLGDVSVDGRNRGAR
jgi:hypothetical protein